MSKKEKKEKRARQDLFADDPEGKKWALESEKAADRQEQFDSFVWTAKRDKLIQDGLDPRRVHEEEEAKRAERLAELEKIKHMRAEQDRENDLWEAEKRRADAEGENFSFTEWVNDEKQFHMKQAQERANIRLREGRPKPIDLLHKMLEVDTEYAFDMRLPYEMLQGMSVEELEALGGDVEMYLELTPQEMDFWKALGVLCQEQIALVTGKRAPVSKDVLEVFQDQTTLEELRELQTSIAEQLGEGEDPEYWEALHRQAVVEIARATLKSIHADKLQQRLEQMQGEKREEERNRLTAELEERMAKSKQESQRNIDIVPTETIAETKVEPSASVEAPAPEPRQKRRREKLVLEEIVDYEEEEEERALQEDRISQLMSEAREIDGMLGQTAVEKDSDGNAMLSEQDLMRVEMERVPEENEEAFADEVEATLMKQPTWIDKYTPRKPRYFNRIKTGYEWNKYNSTHYTSENPPPKVVHGYRFNLFYNDLVNPSITPTFKIEPIPGNHDWVILRFKAGPPYLDVAFKIVNKAWERDGRFGFKAVFERGVLRVWFNLKRTRYKR